MCKAREEIKSSASSVPCRCWTVKGLLRPGTTSWAKQGWTFCPSTQQETVPSTHHMCLAWWGQSAGGERSTMNSILCPSQDVTLLLGQPCSLLSLGKWTLKSDMTDDIFYFLTFKLCFVFAEPSLMPWMWACQRSFVPAPRCCHQAYILYQGEPNLAMFIWCDAWQGVYIHHSRTAKCAVTALAKWVFILWW